jgi:hypothetical protein
MAYWNWRLVRDGVLRFGLMLLSFSFVFQNLSWLNSKFLPQLPVGFILLLIIGIFIMRHIYRTLKWYAVWLKQKLKLENLVIHFCLYLSLCQNHLKCFKFQIKALNSIFSRKISSNRLKMQPSKCSWCPYQIFSSNFKSR